MNSMSTSVVLKNIYDFLISLLEDVLRVVHIGFKYGLNNTGGAAIAATRLHKALLEKGIESHYLCVWKCEEGENVHELPQRGSIARKLYLLLTKITRCIWNFTSYKKSIPLNIIALPGLNKILNKIRPDVVHVHCVNPDVVSFGQLGKLKCKVVINLHDLFVINILNPHPCNDRRYIEGLTKYNSTHLERWLFNRKRRCIRRLSPSFIGPSEWVCNCARASIIGKGFPVHAIPNLIDKTYRYNHELCSRNKKFIILFGAFGGSRNRYKGFAELEQALKMLPHEIKMNCELWVFGEHSPNGVTGGVLTMFVGEITSPEELKKLYHQADIFAFPSLQETQGMTKVEAMLCGLPVISFDRTACPEGIVHHETGWISKDGDIADYKNGLCYFYNLYLKGILGDRKENNFQQAERLYSVNKVIHLFTDVYMSMVQANVTL